MDMYEKIMENAEKIIKVSGFYITAPGDPSVGIFPATWEIKNDFYFDDNKQLEEFREGIECLFESYCGDNIHVMTFEEQNDMNIS